MNASFSPESLGSRYMLGEVLGRGAMGQVFAGTIRPTGEPVAIKVLRPELVSDPEVVARFVQERTILLSITDPHVVRVVDLVVEGETLAIVMELIQGADLRRQLRARGTVPPAEAVQLTGQLLRGAAAIHAGGIVHRDIKPENVLVDTSSSQPQLKLTDFGVARLSYGASLTRMSGLIGTPEYMAPELAEHGQATPSADIYSAGIVLYEMLCGRTPFAGGHPVAVLRRHTDQAPPVIPGVPADLWNQIAWMLAKDPGSRPSSAAEACAALGSLESSLTSQPALAPWSGPEAWTPAQTALRPGQGSPQDHGGSPSGATVRRYRDHGGAAAPDDPSSSAPPLGIGEGLLGLAQAPLAAPSRRKWQSRPAALAGALIAVLGLIATVAMFVTHWPASLHQAADGRTTALKGIVSTAGASASAWPTGARTAAPGSAVSGGKPSGSAVPGAGPSRSGLSTAGRGGNSNSAHNAAATGGKVATGFGPGGGSGSSSGSSTGTSSGSSTGSGSGSSTGTSSGSSAGSSPSSSSGTSSSSPAGSSSSSSAPKTYTYSVYHTCANGACGLKLHSGPGYSSYAVTRTLVDGDAVAIVCQTRGQSVSGIDGSSSDVWDKTAQGDYAADFYVDTPGTTGSFSPPIPQC